MHVAELEAEVPASQQGVVQQDKYSRTHGKGKHPWTSDVEAAVMCTQEPLS